MKNREKLTGIFCAAFTILVWGSTFIFSKQLLDYYTPAQIMLIRFVIAYIVLFLIRPKIVWLSRKDILSYLLVALTGNTLYFLAENYALSFTLASNVSIIVVTAPILTAILAHFVGAERFRRSTLPGFLIAFAGVILVVCNGTFVLKLDPRGDLLALTAALLWAIYSLLATHLTRKSSDSILSTRYMMLGGLLTALPIVLIQGTPFSAAAFQIWSVGGSFLFLGIIGSGLCYFMWNTAFRYLGAVSTNNFIYAQPFVTIVAAFFLLHEPFSPLAILGAVLITAGVIVSQKGSAS